MRKTLFEEIVAIEAFLAVLLAVVDDAEFGCRDKELRMTHHGDPANERTVATAARCHVVDREAGDGGLTFTEPQLKGAEETFRYGRIRCIGLIRRS